MGTFIESFYRKLRDDYVDEAMNKSVEKSIVYKYIEQENKDFLLNTDGNISGEGSYFTKGKTTQKLELYYRLFEEKRETPYEFIKAIITVVQGRTAIYQMANINEQKDIFLPYIIAGLELNDEQQNILKNTTKKKDIQIALIDLVKRMEKENLTFLYEERELLDRTHIQKLYDFAMKNAMQLEIQSFLYDIEHRKRVDKTLTLYDSYCTKYRLEPFAGNKYKLSEEGSLLEEYKKECRQLYDAIMESNKYSKDHTYYHKLLIPLFIDNKTGSMLFLVGRNYFAEYYMGNICRERDKRKFERTKETHPCAFGIISYNSRLEEVDMVSFGYLFQTDFFEFDETKEKPGHPFSKAFDEYEEFKRDAMLEMREGNTRIPPDVPPRFMEYFATDALQVDVKEVEKEIDREIDAEHMRSNRFIETEKIW